MIREQLADFNYYQRKAKSQSGPPRSQKYLYVQKNPNIKQMVNSSNDLSKPSISKSKAKDQATKRGKEDISPNNQSPQSAGEFQNLT
mmetsp:Transcript_2300/g.3008  ORF Transcript_2300/g.3008 Transcript_2300/m.3008 type:complete len:87 (+) Transcript_2300:66-326(+)